MIWIAPSAKDADNAALEKRLWDAADQFRANSGLKSQEYAGGRPQGPVLGLIFLRFAEVRFAAQRVKLESPSPLGVERAAGRGEGYPRPSDGRGAGGEGYSGDPARELSIHGVEKTDETGRLCRLNLAVHGLEGEIKHGGNINSYCDDPQDATGRFDFVLANPPFNKTNLALHR